MLLKMVVFLSKSSITESPADCTSIEFVFLNCKDLSRSDFLSNCSRFGSDNTDRGELVKIAATRAKKLFPGEYSQRVHVGDTVKFLNSSSNFVTAFHTILIFPRFR